MVFLEVELFIKLLLWISFTGTVTSVSFGLSRSYALVHGYFLLGCFFRSGLRYM